MSAETVRASVLIFPNPPTSPRFSEAATSNNTFGLSLSRPFITTLFTAGHNSGDTIAGVLHFPDLPATSTCRNISSLPSTSLHDDLPKSNFTSVALFPVIGFAPWTPRCNKEWLDAARDDRSVLDGFVFYSTNYTLTIPRHDHPYWNGIKFRDYGFPIYGIRGREGQLLMNKYTEFAEQQSILPDINNATGRARVFLEFDTGKSARLPGLWLFLLIVLGVLVAAIVATSCSMHLLQWRRRRSLRNRVARGEVDLEQLGIKRLLVPRKILDKLPLKPYQPGGTIDQPACSICLEDFVPAVNMVRILPCHHQYHPACIDGFLEQQSSLCPLCKASVLPKGYVPPHLTNNTVRREREVRRQRRREMGGGRVHRAWSRMWRSIGWGSAAGAAGGAASGASSGARSGAGAGTGAGAGMGSAAGSGRGRQDLGGTGGTGGGGTAGIELRQPPTITGRHRGFERQDIPENPGKFRLVMRWVFPGY